MKNSCLLLAAVFAATSMISCGGTKLHSTGISSQTMRVDSKLKRSEYTFMEQPFSFEVTNKKEYKKYSLDQLKEVAFAGAEKAAIDAGADGVLNPVFSVEQKKKKYFVKARVKGYKIKNDSDYLDTENSLKHRPTN